MTTMTDSDELVLAQARAAGLPVHPPYDQEILRAHRGLSQIAARLAQNWNWSDEPAFRFDPVIDARSPEHDARDINEASQ